MKESRGGDDKWQEKHLPPEAKARFKEEVVPHIRLLLGSLEPWDLLTPEHVQKVLDLVYGVGTYQATKTDPFFNLVCRLPAPVPVLTSCLSRLKCG